MLVLIAAALLGFTAAGCATQGAPSHIATEIDEGANRIVLDRQTLTEPLTPDAPVLAFYRDVRQYLENTDFGVAQADDDAYVLTSNANQVDDNLWLRLDMNLRPIPGGSRAVTSVEWAPSPGGPWREAAYTSGPAEQAFGEAFMAVSGISHSEIGTSTE